MLALLTALTSLLGACCFTPITSFLPPTPFSCQDLCARMGQCSVRTWQTDGSAWTCYAASNADCERGSDCALSGRNCFSTEDGECVDANQVASRRCAVEWCPQYGMCHSREGVCEAQLPEDCLNSEQCRVEGNCTVIPPGGLYGGCVVSPASCAAATICATEGRCDYQPDPFGGPAGACVRSP